MDVADDLLEERIHDIDVRQCALDHGQLELPCPRTLFSSHEGFSTLLAEETGLVSKIYNAFSKLGCKYTLMEVTLTDRTDIEQLAGTHRRRQSAT